MILNRLIGKMGWGGVFPRCIGCIKKKCKEIVATKQPGSLGVNERMVNEWYGKQEDQSSISSH